MSLQQMRFSEPIKLFVRLLIAGVFGCIVTGLALAAGRDAASSSIIMYAQQNTQHQLTFINRAMVAYQQEKHVLPHTLRELDAAMDSPHRLNIQQDGAVVDGWGRPFVYTIQGTRYRVVSYGQDGKPGGSGMNTDLTSDDPHPPGSGLTWQMFLTKSSTQEMVTTACVSGVLAAGLCFFLVQSTALSQHNIAVRVVGLLFLLGALVFVTTIITAVHVPSGH